MGMPVTTPMAKLMAKILRPEARRSVVVFVAGAQRHGLEDQDQQRQPHGQLGKQVVKRDREGEMQPVNREGVHPFQDRTPRRGGRGRSRES